MFVFTTKLRKKRAVLTGGLLLLLVAGGLLWRFLADDDTPKNETVLLADNAARIEYLQSLGWEVDSEPLESFQLTLSETLSPEESAYNELQRSQGFDLRPYCGKALTRYTYHVTNYPDRPEDVQLNLYLWEDQVVAGDVIAGGENGFQATLHFPEEDD